MTSAAPTQAGTCSGLSNGLVEFSQAVSTSASIAVQRLDALSRTPMTPHPEFISLATQSAQTCPVALRSILAAGFVEQDRRHWREVSFATGDLTQSLMALNRYVRSCTESESEDLEIATQELAAATTAIIHFDTNEARQFAHLFHELRNPDMGGNGFVSWIPNEDQALPSAALVASMRRNAAYSYRLADLMVRFIANPSRSTIPAIFQTRDVSPDAPDAGTSVPTPRR